MDTNSLAIAVKQALILVLWLSLPAVLVASIVGFAVAFIQAITQVQDQTISFGIKLIAVIVAIALTSVWLGGELTHFAGQMFDSIQDVR
jgi:type III secretion protein S